MAETKKTTKKVEEAVIVEEPKEVKAKVVTKYGKVANCYFLNLRQRPTTESIVLEVLPVNTKVQILADNHADFYKVLTENKVEGYCVKEYIEEVK